MNTSDVRQKIGLAEQMKKDARGNEAKWYWQGVIDGLHAAIGEPPPMKSEGEV